MADSDTHTSLRQRAATLDLALSEDDATRLAAVLAGLHDHAKTIDAALCQTPTQKPAQTSVPNPAQKPGPKPDQPEDKAP